MNLILILDTDYSKIRRVRTCYNIITLCYKSLLSAVLDLKAETDQGAGYSGQSAICIDQLKAEDKWDQEVPLTASEDRYEILTEVKSS